LRGASLFTPLAICREAVILGKIAGVLLVEERCRFEGRGIQPVQVRAGALLVERGAEINFPFPVQADEITVRGSLHGDLYCSGKVTIARKGIVHGRVFARSIQMDRGGDLVGPLRIGPVDPPAIHLPGHLDAMEQLFPDIPCPRRKSLAII
jgi:cytoskeletal protein CcmA (bactofilin family)